MKKTGVLLALLIGVGFVVTQTNSKTSVPWAITEWPPYFITRGPDVNQGRLDRLKKILEAHMIEYQFSDLLADTPRTVELWKKGRNVCTGAALRTLEREKWAYFTAFAFQIPHEYVLVTANAAVLEGLPKDLYLKDILARKELKGVFTKGRSYGHLLDEMIRRSSQEGGNQYVIENSSEGYVSLFKMLEKGRYDYLIEYEDVIRAYNEQIFPARPLFYRHLKESFPSVVFHFACTKNAWGQGIVSRVDRLMQEIALTKEYQAAMESWVDGNLSKKNRKLLDEFYQKRAQGPWTTVPGNN